MQFRRSLPGRGSTDFYFTDPDAGGMSREQQEYLADLVMSYRERYPALTVNAVWDFGMEEGDPVRGEKYGVFADSRDNAVYNSKMLTISVNHARLRRMPLAADPHQIREAEAYYEKYRDLSACFEKRQAELLAQGMPWPKIEPAVREEMGIVPCAENRLPV